jgi:hypothetical protein
MAVFKVGDIIISKKGTKPARVTSVYSGYCCVDAVYLHNNRSSQFDKSNIIHYTGDSEETFVSMAEAMANLKIYIETNYPKQ